MNAIGATSDRVGQLIAAGCAVVAVGYAIVGSGAVTVVADQPAGPVPPLLLAAALFAGLAVLSMTVRRRGLWLSGAALQVLVIAGYLLVAADRTPAFEPWGITLKVLQVGLLAAFVWLAAQRPGLRRPDRGTDRKER